MRVREIIATHKVDQFRVDVTQSSDSYNGLIFKNGELFGCVAVGLHEGKEACIKKAIERINR